MIVALSQLTVFISAMLLSQFPEKKQQFYPVFLKYYWLDGVAERMVVFLLTFNKRWSKVSFFGNFAKSQQYKKAYCSFFTPIAQN